MFADTAEAAVGLPAGERLLLTPVKLVLYHDCQVFPAKLLSSQTVPRLYHCKELLSQGRDFAFALAELRETTISPFFHPG